MKQPKQIIENTSEIFAPSIKQTPAVKPPQTPEGGSPVADAESHQAPAIHNLKTNPLEFDLIVRSSRRATIRVADRAFAKGDILILHELREAKPPEFTGRTVAARISDIQTLEIYPDSALAILSLADVGLLATSTFIGEPE